MATIAAITHVAVKPRRMVALRAEAQGINPAIRKNEAKVADTVAVAEFSKPLTPYCRPFLVNENWAWPILPRRRLAFVGSVFLPYHASFNSQILVSANGKKLEAIKVSVLKQKMELLGINCDHSCLPGKFNNLLCPKCKGGKSLERSLSLHIVQNADFAMWRCYRTCCGWAGQTFADERVTNEGKNLIFKVRSTMLITSEGIVLEPLGEKLVEYFNYRRISEETLRRNSVMQIASNQDIIAFTYRQNGVLVGCKFRSIEKKFWQDKGTEKWLYGLDDANEATEIIIVEGEMDKLSMEEAGFQNCVSVPGGAPQVVSSKDLPPLKNLGQSISVSVELQNLLG